MENRTITINSISKTYSVTGWRVGWAIAPVHITRGIRKVHDFLTVGAPTPLQHAAVSALGFQQHYYDNLQKKYLFARDHLMETLMNSGFKPYNPKGAYYIIADVSHLFPMIGASDDFDFSRKLIEKTRVATVPGFSFYSGKNMVSKQVRFAFCKKNETLEAVRKLFYNFFRQ
jgi:aminotransferase